MLFLCPEFDVLPRRGERAVSAPGDAGDAVGVSGEGCRVCPTFPEFDGAVPRRTGGERAVSALGDAGDACGVSVEGCRVGLTFPEFDGLVPRTGCEDAAVSAPGDVVNDVGGDF